MDSWRLLLLGAALYEIWPGSHTRTKDWIVCLASRQGLMACRSTASGRRWRLRRHWRTRTRAASCWEEPSTYIGWAAATPDCSLAPARMKTGSDGLQDNGEWAALADTDQRRVMMGGALCIYRLGSSHDRTGPDSV